MLNTQFRFKTKLGVNQVTDLSMKAYLYGPKINNKEIIWLDTYRRFLTDKINPSRKEADEFLKLRVKEEQCFFESGLAYTRYSNDVGIPYELHGLMCEFSVVGMFDLFYRIDKEFSDGIIKIKHAMRADIDKMIEDIVSPIGDFVQVMSAIGKVLGFQQEIQIASTMTLRYNKKEKIIFTSMLGKGTYGQGLSCTALAFSLFNTLEIPSFVWVYSNYDMNQTATLENMVILNFCHHMTRYEDIEYPVKVQDIQIETEEDHEIAIIEPEKIKEDPIHFGQLKLLVSAYAFLYEVKEKQIEFENLYLLGCGTGHNNKAIIYFLGPKYVYHLYDPVVSSSTYDDMRFQGYVINVFSSVFTEERDFLPKSIAISDIRSELTDEAILYDNYIQWNWSRRLLAISMKFKIPCPREERNRKYNVPTGTIFLQPFRHYASKETRIFHFGRGETKEMLVKEYYEKNNLFNNSIRNKGFTCFDCAVSKKILSRMEVPSYAQMIIPVNMGVKYGDSSGYSKMNVVGKMDGDKGKHWDRVTFDGLFVQNS